MCFTSLLQYNPYKIASNWILLMTLLWGGGDGKGAVECIGLEKWKKNLKFQAYFWHFKKIGLPIAAYIIPLNTMDMQDIVVTRIYTM